MKKFLSGICLAIAVIVVMSVPVFGEVLFEKGTVNDDGSWTMKHVSDYGGSWTVSLSEANLNYDSKYNDSMGIFIGAPIGSTITVKVDDIVFGAQDDEGTILINEKNGHFNFYVQKVVDETDFAILGGTEEYLTDVRIKVGESVEYTFSEEGIYRVKCYPAPDAEEVLYEALEVGRVYFVCVGKSASNDPASAPDTAPAPAPDTAPAPSTETKVVFNDTELKFDMPIINRDNRTFYPMRELFTAMGAEVSWDNATRTASGIKDGKTVEFVIDSKDYKVNGEAQTMDVAAFIESGRTYVPIRYAAEGLGYTVDWNAATNTININVKD